MHGRRRRRFRLPHVSDSYGRTRVAMSLLECIWTGCRALQVNRMRSILTALGIVVGVGAVVCMISVGTGAQSDVSERIRTLGANLLLVKPGAQISGAARLESG